jgi:hypothetical protein
MDNSKDAVFKAIPCLGCECWQRDRALWIVGLIYLMLEKGEKPNIPSLDQVLAGCCKREDISGSTITFLRDPSMGEQILEIDTRGKP